MSYNVKSKHLRAKLNKVRMRLRRPRLSMQEVHTQTQEPLTSRMALVIPMEVSIMLGKPKMARRLSSSARVKY